MDSCCDCLKQKAAACEVAMRYEIRGRHRTAHTICFLVSQIWGRRVFSWLLDGFYQPKGKVPTGSRHVGHTQGVLGEPMLAKLCRADCWPVPAPLSRRISAVLILALQKVLRLGLANIAFPATQNGVASQKNDYAKLNTIRGPNQNARDKSSGAVLRPCVGPCHP
jgi:hypothetical protein